VSSKESYCSFFMDLVWVDWSPGDLAKSGHAEQQGHFSGTLGRPHLGPALSEMSPAIQMMQMVDCLWVGSWGYSGLFLNVWRSEERY
jgi:hypothetical protein